MKKVAVLGISLFVMGCLVSLPVMAQEKNEQAKAPQNQEDTEFNYGTVVKASADSVSIKEYDVYKGEEVEVVYGLTPQTELVGVASAKEILPQDSVLIESALRDGKKVALSVEVEKAAEGANEAQEMKADAPKEEMPIVPANEIAAPEAAKAMVETKVIEKPAPVVQEPSKEATEPAQS